MADTGDSKSPDSNIMRVQVPPPAPFLIVNTFWFWMLSMKKLSADTLRKHKGISFVGVSTCFFVYDSEGHFYMAKRSNKSRDEKGTWEIGGGGLKWGLTAKENLFREIKEEYNATPLKVTFLGYRDVLRSSEEAELTHWVALDFAVLVNPKLIKVNEIDMFDDSGWFTLAKLPSPLHSQQLTFFDKYSLQIRTLLGEN